MTNDTPTPAQPDHSRLLEGQVATIKRLVERTLPLGRVAERDRRMTAVQRRPQAHVAQRRIGAVMALQAASLAVVAFLHLSGIVAVGSKPSADAGIAEAIICLALALGATSLRRGSPAARITAPATISFAIFGFMIGLYEAGDTIEVAYHATVLPLLLLTLVAVLRTRRRS